MNNAPLRGEGEYSAACGGTVYSEALRFLEKRISRRLSFMLWCGLHGVLSIRLMNYSAFSKLLSNRPFITLPETLAHRKVLIVDDNRFQREYLSEIFRKAGLHHVLTANDGVEALEIISPSGRILLSLIL